MCHDPRQRLIARIFAGSVHSWLSVGFLSNWPPVDLLGPVHKQLPPVGGRGSVVHLVQDAGFLLEQDAVDFPDVEMAVIIHPVHLLAHKLLEALQDPLELLRLIETVAVLVHDHDFSLQVI